MMTVAVTVEAGIIAGDEDLKIDIDGQTISNGATIHADALDSIQITLSLSEDVTNRSVILRSEDPEIASFFGESWQTVKGELRQNTAQAAYVKLNIIAAGETTIMVSTADGGASIYFRLVAEKVPVTSIAIEGGEYSVANGKIIQLNLKVLPENATFYKITWLSIDNRIASVDENGLVTGNYPGTTVIRALSQDNGEIYDECTVEVTYVEVESVFLDKAKVNLDQITQIVICVIIAAFALITLLPYIYIIANMVFSCTLAYPLSRGYFKARRFITNMVIITMLFSGGMIPTYMLVANVLNLRDTFWALWLPAAINPFNMIIIKNYFQGIPRELEEASRIDGCNDLQIFLKIILPVSKPVLASVSLFYAVEHWNSYFNAMLYISDKSKEVIQIVLRRIVFLTSAMTADNSFDWGILGTPPEKAVKMATTVFATIPILLVYPFIQKYFTQGIMVGSVKG